MKKIFYILNIIIVILLLNSCKQSCPAFSEQYLEWMPYENNKTIKFKNKTDTIIFEIENFYKSKEQKISNWKFAVSCSPSANFITNIADQLNVSISGLAQILENSNDVDYSYSFNCSASCSDVFYFEVKNDTLGGFGKMHDTTIVIDNINFTDAFYLRNETNSKIKEIYIGKGYGIIKFVETNGTEWTFVKE